MLRSVRTSGCVVALAALSGCWVSPRGGTDHAGSRSSHKPRELRAQANDSNRFEVEPSAGNASDRDFEALLELADFDHDDSVTQDEVEALVARRIDRQVRLRFDRLDRDRDGRITTLEVVTMDFDRFDRFDRDRDGAITLVELAQAIHGQARGRCRLLFARWDQDRDGVLSARDRETTQIAERATQR